MTPVRLPGMPGILTTMTFQMLWSLTTVNCCTLLLGIVSYSIKNVVAFDHNELWSWPEEAKASLSAEFDHRMANWASLCEEEVATA